MQDVTPDKAQLFTDQWDLYGRDLVLRGTPEQEAIALLKEFAAKMGHPRSDQDAKQQYQRVLEWAHDWAPKRLEDALRGSNEEPPSVVKGLVLKGSPTLVSAWPHSIKSLSWLQACMEAPAQKKVWNHFDAPNVERTLFIETEDPAWLVEARIRGFASGLTLTERGLQCLRGFQYLRTGPFDLVEETEKWLRPLLEANRPDFVVLSTLQNLLGQRSYTQQGEMSDVNAAIISLSEIAPIVLITHSPWDKKQRRAAGTVTLAANFATTLHYRKVEKEGDTFAHVKLDSKAGAAETDFRLKVLSNGDPNDPAGVRNVIYGGKGWPKGTKEQAVLTAHGDNADATPKEIADEVGCSEQYVRQVLKGGRNGR